MKRLAVMNDLSGVGRSSLAIELPVISALHVQACPVPTKILSNHTGFSHVAQMDAAPSLEDYFHAWSENGFYMDGLLAGYLGHPDQAAEILQYFSDLCETAAALGKQKPVLLLDPVMADHGKLYKNMDERYITAAQALMAEADVCFPNLTEAALIADCDYEALQETLLSCQSDAGRAMVLHAIFSELQHFTKGDIVITGIEDGESLLNVLSSKDGELHFFRNEKTGQNRPGTGDLFSAIVSAEYINGIPLSESIPHAGHFIADAIAYSEKQNIPVMHGVQFEDLLENLHI